MTLKKQIAELTEEVRRLREEVAALRMFPPVRLVPYVAPPVFQPYYQPYYPQPLPWGPVPQPLGPYWWEYPSTAPQFTFTCNAEGPTTLDGEVS